MLEKIILAAPRGPCAGVNRAIEIVEQALARYGPPVYVNHDLVHNKYVVGSLEKRGVVFSRDPRQIPAGAVYLFSAHGVSPAFRDEIAGRNFHVIDATCPLVTKVHSEAIKFSRERSTLFFVGHKGHPEVEGTMGVAPMTLLESLEDVEKIDPGAFVSDNPVYVLTQTTLSVEDTADIIAALRRKFPALKAAPAKDICYATTNRQKAVLELAKTTEFVIVVGSKHSSNSNRLRETAEKIGTPSILVDRFADIPSEIWRKYRTIGITSGASVPEILVQKLVTSIQSFAPKTKIINLEMMKEDVQFPLPTI